MITLLDYGAGNVRSVRNAIQRLGYDVTDVRSPQDIAGAEKLVFPGVGSFGSAMETLYRRGYVEALRVYINEGRPFLGICLGLQTLFEGSEESPGIPGLGIIRGHVRKLDSNPLSVPHIGWNGVKQNKNSRFFSGYKGEKVYFVHSFHPVIDHRDGDWVLTTTDYGSEFTSGVQKGNVLAVQFHPEKSGAAGLNLLKNFLMSDYAESGCVHELSGRTGFAKRIVACLDVRTNDDGDLVVTKGHKYDVREGGKVRNLGQPVELAGRYFQEGADEICFLNITSFRELPLQDTPMLDVLRRVSENVFVPLTIGGGIRDYRDNEGREWSSLEVAAEYFRSGADKISIGGDAVRFAKRFIETGERTGESTMERISGLYGKQAVVVSVDPRRVYARSPSDTPHHTIETSIPGPAGERYCWYQCTTKGGREGSDIDAFQLSRACEELGVGEILLNCMDRDGTKSGYDLELIRDITDAVDIPVIASSGAGNPQHFFNVFHETDAEAALGAGIFHRREVSIEGVKAYLKEKGIEVR